MAKNELKEQLKSYEGHINDIPLVIDPCKQCKVYKKNGGYEVGHFNHEKDEWEHGTCESCCWFYDSKFEVAIESEKNNTTIAEMLVAQANGKTIQVKMKNGEWRDVLISEQDLKCDASFYRIKS